ncbi:MAG: heme-binding protein [Chloroflexota bacterium]
MFTRPVLDVTDAFVAVDAMLAAAPAITPRPLALAVVDDQGDTVAFVRMDGAPIFNRRYALAKAYTASRMRQDLSLFAAYRAQEARQLDDFADPGLVGSAHGGLVVTDPASGAVVGAIGVSGASPEEDERVAQAGRRALGGEAK